MRPSPFAGKFKKRQIKLQKNDQKNGQPVQQLPREIQENTLKPPSASNMIKLSKDKSKEKNKDPKKIYEMLKQQDEGEKMQLKPSGSFKPNLKLKTGALGKKIKLSPSNPVAVQTKKQQEPQQTPQQQYKPVLKPNLLRKNQHLAFDRRENKQQATVQEEQKNANKEQDSMDGSGNYNQSISMAPKFKIKSKHQPQFPIIHEQPMEQTGFGVNNFADLKIQTRQINFNPSQQRVSSVKIEKQNARAKDLQNLLNLQIDLYEQTLNISCVTSYEIYINKLKSGSLKNSNDQAFDQKSHATCQTATFEFDDFTNQCPQDYHNDVNSITQTDQTEAFNRFVSKVSPVFEELIKPSNTVVMPPIFLLALKPEFKKMLSCPFPVFVYYSSALELGIIVIGEKLYIVQNQIESVLSINNNLIAGSTDGIIYVWTGKNDKGSRLYKKVMGYTQTTNFQLPQYSTQELDRFSIYRGESPIVSLLNQSIRDEFISLDGNCRMIRWRMQRGNNDVFQLKPQSSQEFMNIIQRPNLIGYNLQKRNQNYFICSSAGIIVWNGQQIIQRLDTEGFKVTSLALPHRTLLVYVTCEDGTVRIYQQHYTNELYKFTLPDPSPIVDIIVPQTEYDNKKLSLTSKLFVITANGSIYNINLLSNSSQAKLLFNKEDKKQRDAIYKGVNKLSKGFELVTLWRDLKCTSQMRKMNVNLQPTVDNIKGILQENRQVHSWLESSYSLTVIQ